MRGTATSRQQPKPSGCHRRARERPVEVAVVAGLFMLEPCTPQSGIASTVTTIGTLLPPPFAYSTIGPTKRWRAYDASKPSLCNGSSPNALLERDTCPIAGHTEVCLYPDRRTLYQLGQNLERTSPPTTDSSGSRLRQYYERSPAGVVSRHQFSARCDGHHNNTNNEFCKPLMHLVPV
jgi:hypothetical protein